MSHKVEPAAGGPRLVELLRIWLSCLGFPWTDRNTYTDKALNALAAWRVLHAATLALLAMDLRLAPHTLKQIEAILLSFVLLFFVAGVAVARWREPNYSQSSLSRWVYGGTFLWGSVLWFSTAFIGTMPFFVSAAVLATHGHVPNLWESTIAFILMCGFFILIFYSTKGFKAVASPRYKRAA